MRSVLAVVSLSSGFRIRTNIKVISFGDGWSRGFNFPFGAFYQHLVSPLFDQAWQGFANKDQQKRNDSDDVRNPVGPMDSGDLALEYAEGQNRRRESYQVLLCFGKPLASTEKGESFLGCFSFFGPFFARGDTAFLNSRVSAA